MLKMLNGAKLVYAILLSPVLWLTYKYSMFLHYYFSKPLRSNIGLSDERFSMIESTVKEFDDRKINDMELLSNIESILNQAISANEFNQVVDKYTENEKNIKADLTLAKSIWYFPFRRWYVKIHFMDFNEHHKLHAHDDVISLQIMMSGTSKVEEFDIISVGQAGELRLRELKNDIYNSPVSLKSTRDFANVHGFRALDYSVIRIQFYLRGGYSGLKALRPKGGRKYIVFTQVRAEKGEAYGQIRRE